MPFGQELGMDILVVGELSEEQALFRERIRDLAGRETAHAFGGDMHEIGAVLFAEGYQVLHAAIIDILNVRTL